MVLVSHPSTVSIHRKYDRVFNMASQRRVAVWLKISSPFSVLEIGHVHLSRSLNSCHNTAHYYICVPLLDPPQNITVFLAERKYLVLLSEKSEIKHTMPERASQVREMLNSSCHPFQTILLSRTQERVGLETACAE